MSPAYIAAQKKALWAIVVNADYPAMLRMHRRHFEDQSMGTIYDAACDCIRRGVPINAQAVSDAMTGMQIGEKARDISRAVLNQIASATTEYGHNLPEYLGELYREHQAEKLVEELATKGLTDKQRVKAIGEAATRMVDTGEEGGMFEMEELIKGYIREQEEGIPTSIMRKSIDLHHPCLGPMFSSRIWPFLYTIIAQPRFGKTRVMVNLALELMLRRRPGIFFSFEDSETKMMLKVLSSKFSLSFNDLTLGQLSKDGIDKLKKGVIGTAFPMRVDPRLYSLTDWEMAVRRACESSRVDWIMVDHLHAFRYSRRDEVSELNTITKSMVALSKKYEIPIIMACQVNERQEDRQTGEVILNQGNAKGSGSIFEDSRFFYAIDGVASSRTRRWKCLKHDYSGLYQGSFTDSGESGQIVDYVGGA